MFDECQGSDDGVEEFSTEAGSASFVPADGFGQVRRRPVRWTGLAGSPAEDLFLDPALDVLPGLELHRSSLDRGDAPFNLKGPRRFSIGIGWAVKTCQKLSGNFRAGVKIEA